MTKIAILSDTHGLLREEVKSRLATADVILHAGDINTRGIVDELNRLAKLYIVRGNNDGEWAADLPQSASFSIEGIRFFLIHNRKGVPEALSDVDVIVFGHSHKYGMEERDGVLWLNPGSCGKRRFHQEISFCMMEADQRRYRVEKIVIPHEEG